MPRDVETILGEMRANPADVRFTDACKVADHFFEKFGKPRSYGTSHRVYKMPWAGDPRINLQRNGSKTKRYQVVQVVEAVDKLSAMKTAKAVEDAKKAATAAPAAKTAKKRGKSGRKD